MSTLEALGDIFTVERIVRDGVPSVSVAILEDGKVSSRIFTTEGNQNTNTIYQACSISKAITTLAVAKLVDQGRFSYDTKIAAHLSQDVLDTVVDAKTAHFIPLVTVRMLLSHTSGLSQGGFPGYAGEPAKPMDILAGKHPSVTPKVRFVSFPGAQFSYSGGGFTLLQLFLEKVMALPFPEIMQQVVLKPLGMHRSHYGDLPATESNYAKAYWNGVTQNVAGYHKYPELAAAGLWTTPSDMLKAIAAIQRSLSSSDGFLRNDTATTMLAKVPQSTEAFGGVALGWGVENGQFAHSGYNFPGFNSYVIGFEGSNNGVAVMANGFDGFIACVRKVVSALYYLKQWPQGVRMPMGFGKCDFVPYAAPEKQQLDSTWKEWTGKWDGGWSLVDDAGPKLGFRGFPAMSLKPGAIGAGKGEIVFVVDGLDVAIKLWKADGQHKLELWQAQPQELKRTE